MLTLKSVSLVALTFLGGVFALASAGCSKAACQPGATTESSTGICMVLPAGAKFSDVKKSGDSQYVGVDKMFGLTVWLDKSEPLDDRAKVIANMASSDLKLVESGATPTGGKFFHFHNGPRNYDFAVALVPGGKHLYRCEIQNASPADAKPMLDACKTLAGP